MEKPGIEPATPGLQGIALIHYTTGASQGLTNLDINWKKNAPIVLLYDTVSLFLILYQVFSYKFTQARFS